MKISLTIFFLTVSAVSVLSQGGITGGLGGPDDKPERDDNPPLKGHGGILPSQPKGKSKFKPVKTEKEKREQLLRIIEINRRSLKEIIADLEKLKRPPKIVDVTAAERRLKWLKKRLEIMKKQLDVADRNSAVEMRDAEDAFKKKWADTAAAAEGGKKPEGVSGNKWAEKLDAYQKAKTNLEAKKAYLAWKLKNKRKQQLKDQEQMIESARATLKRIKDAGEGGSDLLKKIRLKELSRQAHAARIALYKRELEDYNMIQSEVRGGKSARKDTLMNEVFRSSPYWFVNELAKVVREMNLQWATKPLTKEQQGLSLEPRSGGAAKPDASDGKNDDGGIPLSDWMKNKPNQKGISAEDWKKAQLKSLAADLADSNRRLKIIDQTIEAADVMELRELRAQLEAADSRYGSASDKAKRETKIAAREKELKASRAQRQKDARKVLEERISYLKKKVVEKSR